MLHGFGFGWDEKKELPEDQNEQLTSSITEAHCYYYTNTNAEDGWQFGTKQLSSAQLNFGQG